MRMTWLCSWNKMNRDEFFYLLLLLVMGQAGNFLACSEPWVEDFVACAICELALLDPFFASLWATSRPSNPIVKDSKQLSQWFIVYYLDSVAMVNDNNIIWVWFDRHRYINDPCKKVEKNFQKFFQFFFQKYYNVHCPSTIIYYRLLSKYCLLLSYSHYRFHYRNSIATLESLVDTRIVCPKVWENLH